MEPIGSAGAIAVALAEALDAPWIMAWPPFLPSKKAMDSGPAPLLIQIMIFNMKWETRVGG